MANSSRLYTDGNGKIFIPMNVETSDSDNNFLTTGKMVILVLSLLGFVVLGVWLYDLGAALKSYILFFTGYALIFITIVRFYIFEEKYYYRMYKQLRDNEITTPAMFWNISSIKDTPDGAIMTYTDAKIGVIVRLERDTVTGKDEDFKEVHYDAISDFYKEVMNSRFKFVQMNLMEEAGKDPRLVELDKLVNNCENKNIRSLMEKQVGYIKNITHHTLYESDYFLFYTSDISRFDNIISDVVSLIYKILDGGYIGYRILSARDIVEFVREQYGVKYFNHTEATLEMFKNAGMHTHKPFDLVEILYADGDVQKVDSDDIIKINKLASDVISGAISASAISLKQALFKNKNQNNKVDFDLISKGFSDVNTSSRRGVRRGMSNRQTQNQTEQAKTEQAKAEQAKIEQAKTEQAKAEQAKTNKQTSDQMQVGQTSNKGISQVNEAKRQSNSRNSNNESTRSNNHKENKPARRVIAPADIPTNNSMNKPVTARLNKQNRPNNSKLDKDNSIEVIDRTDITDESNVDWGLSSDFDLGKEAMKNLESSWDRVDLDNKYAELDDEGLFDFDDKADDFIDF